MEHVFWAKYELQIRPLKLHVSRISPFSLVGGVEGTMDDVYERLKLLRYEVEQTLWVFASAPRLGSLQETFRYIDAWVRTLREQVVPIKC